MLASLTIKNVVLIDQLTIEFENGLCALTGETGAGKSILLDSLGLALGARSEATLVKAGTDQAQVTAEFPVDDNHPARALLRDQDLLADGPLILRRSVGKDGRSRAFINDQAVSVGLLKEVGEMLVEIHGQFDTQTLLNPRVHRDLIDDYGSDAKTRRAVSSGWQSWKEQEEALVATRAALEKARTDEAYLRGAVEDLDELSPKVDEEGTLTALRERLMRREQTFQNLNAALAAAEEMENAMTAGWRALEKIGDDAAPMLGAMDRINVELQEMQNGIHALSADLENSEYSLEEIDDRLFALKAQARKHNCTIDELPAKREELAAALNLIEKQDDTLADLIRAVDKARKEYVAAAQTLHDQRLKAAAKLDKLVAKELPPLKLDKARFETVVEETGEGEWGPGGMDTVQFLVATNPGAPAGPLNKIASGGEMARFMLALKVVLAEVGVAGTLVFDEVDSGIGGATADAVGERLARLAQKRQILVVTHSPQVAARAVHHFIVSKSGTKAVTTNVIPLSHQDQRQEEIARMLSGASITAEARAAAAKLLEINAA
jgi:DNA repair protein RecN (Recombination protein N)